MSYKRNMLTVTTCLLALVIILVLFKCSSTNVSADPIVGPPTLETYLINITASIQIFKWMAGGMSVLFTFLIAALIYAYKRDIKGVNDKADGAFKEINTIKRDFLSLEGHDRGCPHRSPTIEAGH